MKKLFFKNMRMAVAILCGITFFAAIMYSCHKNVGDVYDYETIVLAPDFEVLNVSYDFDNDALNSESTLSFKVEFTNNETRNNSYASVLNFYVDETLKDSRLIENITGSAEYEQIFVWKASHGAHEFRFDINLKSDGALFVQEENTSNNTLATSINIAAKKLLVESEAVVETEVVETLIAADTASHISDVLEEEDLAISDDVEVTQETYDDGTTIVVAGVENESGEVDSSMIVVAVNTQQESTDEQQQEATITVVASINDEDESVAIYNDDEVISYKDGILSLSTMKSTEDFTSCSEPSNMASFIADQIAVNAATAEIEQRIAANGWEKTSIEIPGIILLTLAEYDYTQGDIDNPPGFTAEIISSTEVCSEDCVNDVKVEIRMYPGFILRFIDDRSKGVVKTGTTNVISTYAKDPDCSTSNKGSYSFEDCGGNTVTFVFSAERTVNTTDLPCVDNVHN